VASDKKADDWAALLSLPRPRYITAMLLQVLIHLLLALAAMAATPAKYYMDDTDSSITWVGPWMPLNASFAPITWANASDCYNKTFTVGQGYTYQQHGLKIPFTGTGITLFVAYNNKLGLNVSITLDSNFTTINWFIMDYDYESPTTTTYNATLYDIQGLDDGIHDLNIVIQDYRGNQSDMMFDYAVVTGVRRTIETSSGNSKIGAGIGGGLAALAVIVALAMSILYTRRRTRQKMSSMELDLIDPDAKDPSLFHRASNTIATKFRPGHHRHQSSFSQSAGSPISPVKPTYGNFFGGPKHPFQPLPS